MQAFIIESANKPGELARQTSVIAERDINVYPFSLGLGSRGGSAYIAADEAGVRNALTGAGIKYHEVPRNAGPAADWLLGDGVYSRAP